MAKAITSIGRLKVGAALLGRHGDGRGSPVQQVHDGDTVIVEAAGNLSIRFLGTDTPEVSFPLPDSNRFTSISNPAWSQFLEKPLELVSNGYAASLDQDLRSHLKTATGPGCAENHAFHAERAHRLLEQMVIADMQILGNDKDSFVFFLAFAHEIMDGYGRLLCFLNRHQPSESFPEPRPSSYNERMLAAGYSSPYFIWPNVNPFRAISTLRAAVPAAGDIQAISEGPHGLGPARAAVKQARSEGLGIYDPQNPLILQPFELRFLAGERPPSRWVIDLSEANTRSLLPPSAYPLIPRPEDRLFIPDEYVPLFMQEGWQVG